MDSGDNYNWRDCVDALSGSCNARLSGKVRPICQVFLSKYISLYVIFVCSVDNIHNIIFRHRKKFLEEELGISF